MNGFVDYHPVAVSGSGVTGRKYWVDKLCTISSLTTKISAMPGDLQGLNRFGLLQYKSEAGANDQKMIGVPNSQGFWSDDGNEQLIFANTASAVNNLGITNA